MSGLLQYEEISQIGGFTALTPADADYFAIDPDRCTGGGDAPLRTSVFAAPGEDGALIFPPFDDAEVITIAGDLVVTSTGYSADAGYKAAVSTLYGTLKTALDAGKTGTIELVHPGGTLSVWKHAPLEPAWKSFWVCQVTFSVAVDVFA